MKLLLTTTLIASLSLAAAGDARAQTRRQRPRQPPQKEIVIIAPVQVPVDQGRLEGGRYSNDFFDFSFDIPKGWVAQDVAAKQQIAEMGRSILSEGATERKKAGTEAAMKRTYLLLSASKYDPTKPPPGFNAILMCIAERVPTAIVKNETDYITLMLSSLKGTSVTAEMSGPLRTERVGGGTFTTGSIKMAVGGAFSVQKVYVRLLNGYALMLAYTYVDEPDLKTFEDILKTVKFK